MENPDNECLRSNTGYVGTTAAASTQTLPKWHGKDDRHNPDRQTLHSLTTTMLGIINVHTQLYLYYQVVVL
jgi:hypothetical protein